MGSALALWHYCDTELKIKDSKLKIQDPELKIKNSAQDIEGEAKSEVNGEAKSEVNGEAKSEVKSKAKSPASVTVIVPNAFPAFFNWMPGAKEVKVYEKEAAACDKLIAEADLFLCTDFNDPKRIGPMGEKMLANKCPKVLIDHHIKGQSTEEIWTEEYVDSSASSACEIVYKLIAPCGHQKGTEVTADQGEEAEVMADEKGAAELTNEIATCIYTGLMTDTGNFSFNSTNAELYDIIASLIRAGVKKDEIYNAVFNQYSTDRMRLAGYALYRKMRIYPEYHLALIMLTADELDQYHYQQGDCEGLVNMPLQIANVYYSVFMREERAKPGTPKSRIRVSLRSQGDRPVNIWANEVFHGGGHMNASGGEVLGSMGYALKVFEQSYGKYVKKD